METSKVLALGVAVGTLLDAMAKAAAKVGPEKSHEAMKPVIMEKLPVVIKAIDELLLAPTADDIALISMETRLAAKLFLLATKPNERDAIAYLLKEIELTVQHYLLHKTAQIAENEKVVTYVTSNLPK